MLERGEGADSETAGGGATAAAERGDAEWDGRTMGVVGNGVDAEAAIMGGVGPAVGAAADVKAGA